MKNKMHLFKATNAGLMIFLFLLSFSTSQAQYEGDAAYYIRNQDDVNNFSLTIIFGDLVIKEDSTGSIINLDGLSELTTIQGNVQIHNNTAITNLNGLSNLSNINGALDIHQPAYSLILNNKSLINIDGLSGIDSIYILTIENNDSLENVDGLSNLVSVERLEIIGNGSLQNITGLFALQEINDLTIGDNDALDNLDGLVNLRYIGGLSITSNDHLSNISGLSGLANFSTLVIKDNTELFRFCYLYEPLSTIDYFSVEISGNGSNPTPEEIVAEGPCPPENVIIASQADADNFRYKIITGNLLISCPDITNLDSLISLNTVGGRLAVFNCPNIHNLSGLRNLTSIGGNLEIYGNKNLTTLEGLSNLNSAGDTVSIHSNKSLNQFCGLYNLFNSGYAGMVIINGNADNPTKEDIISNGACSEENGSITSVGETGAIPEEYSLSQNYPNPFNPVTTIKYALPVAAHVQLKIYNALGQLVASLINGSMNAGYHEYTFDASSLSSGIYLYKIEAGNFIKTNKMILLK